jgi:hypothetical protein
MLVTKGLFFSHTHIFAVFCQCQLNQTCPTTPPDKGCGISVPEQSRPQSEARQLLAVKIHIIESVPLSRAGPENDSGNYREEAEISTVCKSTGSDKKT